MKNEIKLNTIIWISLIGLILASFFMAETKTSHLLVFLAVISAIKFIAVIFQFVETKHAHLVWKMLGLTFIAIYLIGLIYYN